MPKRQAATVMALAAILAIVVLAVCCALWAARSTHEGFAAAAATQECPKLATQDPASGAVRLEPGGKTLPGGMAEYVKHMEGLVAAGLRCTPPLVDTLRDDAAPLPGEHTSATTPIAKLDDYEYTRVFQAERDNRVAVSDNTLNQLVAGNVLDWAKRPFTDSDRAAAEKEFVAGREQADLSRDPKSGVFFRAAEGVGVHPPDADAEEERERSILAKYHPKDLPSITGSDLESVADMVRKLYADDPDWEPVVEQVGPTEFRVTELVPKPRKEEWAEDKPTTISDAVAGGLLSPSPRAQLDAAWVLGPGERGQPLNGGTKAADPFFNKAGVADHGADRFWKWSDFAKWTPGLERMFVPTFDTKAWY